MIFQNKYLDKFKIQTHVTLFNTKKISFTDDAKRTKRELDVDGHARDTSP